MIIKDLQNPRVLETTEDGCFKILSGYIDSYPFQFWYQGPLQLALFSAENAWEAKKKTLYGPETHVETMRDDSYVLVDKYKSPV